MIWIGTSGFQYPEWKGSFYPATLSAARMLPFYAEHFPTTEINYSFRRIPSVKTLSNWSAMTPEKFRFSLKAPQEITHVRKLRGCGAVLTRFVETLATLGGKRGPVLFQLPPLFKQDAPLLDDFLAELSEIKTSSPSTPTEGSLSDANGRGGQLDLKLASASSPTEPVMSTSGLSCAFEFRHDSWFKDETFVALKSHNAALCVAESENLATPVTFATDFGYFRLRREDYTSDDIERWAKTIRTHRTQLSEIFVYFKHEEAGVGPKFAKQLMDELRV